MYDLPEFVRGPLGPGPAQRPADRRGVTLDAARGAEILWLPAPAAFTGSAADRPAERPATSGPAAHSAAHSHSGGGGPRTRRRTRPSAGAVLAARRLRPVGPDGGGLFHGTRVERGVLADHEQGRAG